MYCSCESYDRRCLVQIEVFLSFGQLLFTLFEKIQVQSEFTDTADMVALV